MSHHYPRPDDACFCPMCVRLVVGGDTFDVLTPEDIAGIEKNIKKLEKMKERDD